MAVIFFSSDWMKRVLSSPEGTVWHDTPATGYGNLRSTVRQWGEDRGHTFTTSPDEAEMELFVGDPGAKPDPHMWPSAIFTMFEQTRTPARWAEVMPGWGLIVVPSGWVEESFSDQFREMGTPETSKKLRRVPLGIHTDAFPYVERPETDTWTIIGQGVELRDRKGLHNFHGIFSTPKRFPLPSDLRVVIKILPVADDGVIVDPYRFELGQLTIHAEVLPGDEFRAILAGCDYSVNPTSGEGFGLIPLEHMSTGMGVAVTHWSGVMDYIQDDLFRPIDYRIVQGQLPGAVVAKATLDSVYEAMIWSYENQDEVRRLGRVGSEFVAANWTTEKMFAALDDVVDEMSREDRRVNDRRRQVVYEGPAGLRVHEDGRILRA